MEIKKAASIRHNHKNTSSKDKHFNAELEIIYDAFYKEVSTMRMVSVRTGIDRANITRHVATLRKADKIQVVKKGTCPISKYSGVMFLSTNPSISPLKQKTNER